MGFSQTAIHTVYALVYLSVCPVMRPGEVKFKVKVTSLFSNHYNSVSDTAGNQSIKVFLVTDIITLTYTLKS